MAVKQLEVSQNGGGNGAESNINSKILIQINSMQLYRYFSQQKSIFFLYNISRAMGVL